MIFFNVPRLCIFVQFSARYCLFLARCCFGFYLRWLFERFNFFSQRENKTKNKTFRVKITCRLLKNITFCLWLHLELFTWTALGSWMICSSVIPGKKPQCQKERAHVFIDTEVSHSFKGWRRYPLTLHPSVNGRRFRSKNTVTTATPESAITTEDTTIATTGKETLVLNATGLGLSEPPDGVEDVGVGTDVLRRLGLTETKKYN